MVRWIVASALVATCLLQPGGAQAQIANNMSCQQAVAFFEANRRIQVSGRGNIVTSITSGAPVSRRNELRCPTTAIFVNTTDNPRCIVAYRCIERGGGR